ncbi:MAG: lysophospholipid acyltransferase family protein [Pirellulaceae bacterium]
MGYERTKHWLTYLMVRVVVCIIQSVPLRFCREFSRVMATVAWRLVRFRRELIDENLKHAFPSMSQQQRNATAFGMWEHLVLMICEIAHTSRKIHRTNWRRHIHVSGDRKLVTQLLESRPLVLLTGHFGNFELAGYAAGLYGFSNHTIARPLDNPYLNDFIAGFRQLNGQYILPKQGSSAEVQRLLRENGTLALLGDQYAGRKGCWIDFLGRPASYHKAIALFSLTNNAPLATCYARRLGKPLQFEISVEDFFDPTSPADVVADIPGITRWYNGVLESVIRRHPAQYWWVHRRWKGDPPAPAQHPSLARSA